MPAKREAAYVSGAGRGRGHRLRVGFGLGCLRHSGWLGRRGELRRYYSLIADHRILQVKADTRLVLIAPSLSEYERPAIDDVAPLLQHRYRGCAIVYAPGAIQSAARFRIPAILEVSPAAQAHLIPNVVFNQLPGNFHPAHYRALLKRDALRVLLRHDKRRGEERQNQCQQGKPVTR